MSKLYATATNTSNIVNAQVSNSFSDTAPMASIKAISTSLGIGDSIEVNLGYEGDYSKVFAGYVKEVKRSQPPTTYDINAYGHMIRAADYFIASDSADNPLSYSNIPAETLIGNIMSKAGLNSYGYDATSFTFATQGPLEINLVSAYDYCKTIADTLAFHLYADMDGKVWFVERWGRIMDTDTSDYTMPGPSNVLQVSYSVDERDLRNRVVVYGGGGISATASEASPYLPANFYKTVVASAEWIDNQSMAQNAADYNLELLHVLNKEVNATFIGKHNVFVRDVVTFDYPALLVSGLWLIDTVDHNWGKSGFTTQVRMRK